MEYLSEFNEAKSLAKKIGVFLKKQENISVKSSFNKDIKLDLDLIANDLIKNEIRKFSIHNILSEESGIYKSKLAYEPYWIIDPIDGSMNYLRKFPYSSISIAFWQDSEPIFGVIYDIESEICYSGYVGFGARVDDNNFPSPLKKAKSDSIIATGFPLALKLDENYIREFYDVVKDYKKVRMIGCASLSIVLVLTGVFDSYYEKNIAIWDVAAGIALAKSLNISFIKYVKKENNLINIHL